MAHTSVVPSPSEAKLLQDEPARSIAGAEKRGGILGQLRIQIGQLMEQMGKGGGRITYHWNPYSPQSAKGVEKGSGSLQKGGRRGRAVTGRTPRLRGVREGRRGRAASLARGGPPASHPRPVASVSEYIIAQVLSIIIYLFV